MSGGASVGALVRLIEESLVGDEGLLPADEVLTSTSADSQSSTDGSTS